MSLRQDVLRSLTLADLALERKQATSARHFEEDSDDELICVVSVLHDLYLVSPLIISQDLQSRDARTVSCAIATQFQTGLAHSASEPAQCSELHFGFKAYLIRSFEGLSHSTFPAYIPMALDTRPFFVLEGLMEMEQEPDAQLQ